MHLHRNATAIVRDGYRAIDMQADFNNRAVAGEMLINRVIKYFEHTVVQTTHVRVSNIHARTFANRLQTLACTTSTKQL